MSYGNVTCRFGIDGIMQDFEQDVRKFTKH